MKSLSGPCVGSQCATRANIASMSFTVVEDVRLIATSCKCGSTAICWKCCAPTACGSRPAVASSCSSSSTIGRGACGLREIHDASRGEADRTSVYRNLIAFERLGIIQGIKLPDRDKTYQYVLDRKIHHFYICKACGNARRGNRKLFERIEAALRDTHGFAKANLSVVFYGTCVACASSASSR